MLFHFFIFLPFKFAKSSSISLSELSSIVLLQCPLVAPKHHPLILVQKDGKVGVPRGMFKEHTIEGFICTKSANIRISMWNSGYFRDYLLAVKSSSDFITYVNDFVKRMNESGGQSSYDRPTMLLLLKDGIMFALAIEHYEEADLKLFYIILNKVIHLATCLIKYVSAYSSTLFPCFSTPKCLPNLPFNQHLHSNRLSILSAIRMVRLSESSHVGAEYDTSEIVLYIVRNFKMLHPPWMSKSRVATASIFAIEPWIEP